MARVTVEITPLEKILYERSLTQTNLQKMLEDAGHKMYIQQVHCIVKGKSKNYGVRSAIAIAEVLQIPVDVVLGINGKETTDIVLNEFFKKLVEPVQLEKKRRSSRKEK